MPVTEVLLYRERDGSVPFRDWLDGLPEEARIRCLARLALLEEKGHDLRRPHAENLGRGIYELRVKVFRVNYRMLYFFHGRAAAVVSHGLAKEKEVPPEDIELALARMAGFKKNPGLHTFNPE